MIAPEEVAVILLAAGLSRRFGERDKLLQPLNGLALGLHAARTLDRLPFAAKIAVTNAHGPDYEAHGFVSVVNANAASGQSSSIRVGLVRAREHKPSAVLIALADMPFIGSKHVLALMKCFDNTRPIIASTSDGIARPPALFAAPLFDTLARLSGDTGARSLLKQAVLINGTASELVDIDTPADFPNGLSDAQLRTRS